MRHRLALIGALLLLGGSALASIPDCPEDAPFADCPQGNPCEAPKGACGRHQWCKRGCGCSFRCLDHGIITVAGGTALLDVDGDMAAADASAMVASTSPTPAAGGGVGSSGGGGGIQLAAVDAPAAGEMRAPAQRSLLPGFGPISLPDKPFGHVPNFTALAEAVHESLAAAIQHAVQFAVKFKPLACPDGRPLVQCMQDSCAAKPCGKSQVCVPDCGSCTTHRCVDVSLPWHLPSLPEVPSLPLPKLPRISLPKPPCANNEAMNLGTTLKTIPAHLLMSQDHRLSISCSTCPNGTVSKQPALSCSLCMPGTYADRSLSVCRKCNKGYVSHAAGAQSCSPCPANTFAPLPGGFMCIPCPPGFTTNGKKAQSSCAFDASYRTLKLAG